MEVLVGGADSAHAWELPVVAGQLAEASRSSPRSSPVLPGPAELSSPSSPPDSEAQQAAAGAMGAMGGTPENVEPP